ncbi:MAG: hypothetical protein ACU83U_15970 [Gammaproteobacteria bacterium]
MTRFTKRQQLLNYFDEAVYKATKAKNPARCSQDTRNWDWQAVVCLPPDKPNCMSADNLTHTVH